MSKEKSETKRSEAFAQLRARLEKDLVLKSREQREADKKAAEGKERNLAKEKMAAQEAEEAKMQEAIEAAKNAPAVATVTDSAKTEVASDAPPPPPPPPVGFVRASRVVADKPKEEAHRITKINDERIASLAKVVDADLLQAKSEARKSSQSLAALLETGRPIVSATSNHSTLFSLKKSMSFGDLREFAKSDTMTPAERLAKWKSESVALNRNTMFAATRSIPAAAKTAVPTLLAASEKNQEAAKSQDKEPAIFDIVSVA